MLVTLFLTRYLMPVLYSFFPGPVGHAASQSKSSPKGSHYTDEFLPALLGRPATPPPPPGPFAEEHGGL